MVKTDQDNWGYNGVEIKRDYRVQIKIFFKRIYEKCEEEDDGSNVNVSNSIKKAYIIDNGGLVEVGFG